MKMAQQFGLRGGKKEGSKPTRTDKQAGMEERKEDSRAQSWKGGGMRRFLQIEDEKAAEKRALPEQEVTNQLKESN